SGVDRPGKAPSGPVPGHAYRVRPERRAGPESFPLVIYHAGAGSSFEDNSVLCEFLASHGFVVLGSAFPERSGKSFNTDGGEGSAAAWRFWSLTPAHCRP